MTGLAITSPEIVIAVLIDQLGGSAIAVGCVFALTEIGIGFPQLFMAPFVERVARKKRFIILYGIGQRLPWLAVGLLFFIVTPGTDGSLVPVILVLISASFLSGGLMGPAWGEYVASTVPMKWRGRLFALRQAIAAGIGIPAGLLIAYVIGTYAFPLNYSILFLLVFVIWGFSYVALVLVKETPAPVRKHESLRHYFFVHVPAILGKDRDFVSFLLLKVAMLLSMMSFGFYAVYAQKKFDLNPSVVGQFTSYYMIGQIVFSYGAGILADRFGHRINAVLFGLTVIAQCLIAIWAQSVLVYSTIFFLSGAVRIIQIITFVGMPMEYADSIDRPTYYALSNTLTAPFYLSGMLGGALIGWFGYQPVFLLTAGFALVTVVLEMGVVRDPRSQRRIE